VLALSLALLLFLYLRGGVGFAGVLPPSFLFHQISIYIYIPPIDCSLTSAHCELHSFAFTLFIYLGGARWGGVCAGRCTSPPSFLPYSLLCIFHSIDGSLPFFFRPLFVTHCALALIITLLFHLLNYWGVENWQTCFLFFPLLIPFFRLVYPITHHPRVKLHNLTVSTTVLTTFRLYCCLSGISGMLKFNRYSIYVLNRILFRYH
jgi:hypothetical protein